MAASDPSDSFHASYAADTPGAPPPTSNPRAALERLLEDYDRENRLRIDAVYAQFSPTLDDFYAEDLRLEFPRPGIPSARETGDATDPVRPEIILTRTVPGQAPKSVRAPGAPFPVGEARRLLASALRATAADPTGHAGRAATAEALVSGAVVLEVRQAGRSQAVELVLEPGGRPVLELLDAPA